MNVENKNRRKQSNGEKNFQENLGLAICQPACQNVGPLGHLASPPARTWDHLCFLCCSCSTLLFQIVAQQPAGDFAIEKRDLRRWWHSDRPGQTRISREHETRPARTSLMENLS